MGHQHVAVGQQGDLHVLRPGVGQPLQRTRAPSGPIPARVYGPNDQVVPQGWIHNLEHGGLVILYQGTAPVPRPRGRRLQGLFDAFPPVAHPRSPVIARFDQMSSPFQAILWGRVLPLQTFDQAKITGLLEPMGRPDQPGDSSARPRTAARARAPPSAERRAVPVRHAGPRRRPTATDTPAPSAAAEPPRRRRADRAGPADAPRLVSRRSMTRARPSSSASRLIPVMDGYLTGPDLEPASLDDLRRRAATLSGATGIALDDVETSRRSRSPARSSASGSTTASTPARAAGRSRPARSSSRSSPMPSSPTATRSSGRRAPTRSTSRSSSASSSGRRPDASDASRRARARRGLRGRQRRQRPRLAGRPGGPRARARSATASGCAPRARTRSCRWARSSSPPTRSRTRRRSASARGGSRDRAPTPVARS